MASLAVQPSSALAAVTGDSNRSASPAHHSAALPVPAAVAALAPGAPAAVPGQLKPVPSCPPRYLDWFKEQEANIDAARQLKKADPVRCTVQGLGKELAMVWEKHAGVDPTDDKRRVTKRDVLVKQIEFAQARVDHWKMVEANPAWNELGAHIKGAKLAGDNLKVFQKQLDKLDNVKRPRGGSSGGSSQFGKGERGPVRNDATKAGQLARVPKGVTLPPGVERVYASPCGTVIYQLKVGNQFIASKSAIMAKDQLLARRAGGGSGRGRGGGGGEGGDGDDEDEEADDQEVQVDIDTDAILANARLTTYDKTKMRRALLRIVKLTPQERVAVLGEDLAGLVTASTGSDSDGDNSDGDGSDGDGSDGDGSDDEEEDEQEDEQEEGAAAAAFQPAARGGVRKATEAAPKAAPSAAAAAAAATVTPAANRRNIQPVSLASDSEGEDEEEPAAPAPAAQTAQPTIETVDLVSDDDDEIKEEAAPAAPAAAAVATQPVEVIDLVSDDEEDASDGDAAAEMAVALPETQPPAAMEEDEEEEEEAAEAATMPHATLAVDATPLAAAEDEAADDEEMEEAESEDEPDAEEEEEAAAKPAARGGKRKAPASKPKAAPKPKAQSTRATRGSGAAAAAKGKTAAPKRTRR